MVYGICSKCKRKITRNRTAHLKEVHGIDADFKGAVKMYFLRPEEVGLTKEEFDKMAEGEHV